MPGSTDRTRPRFTATAGPHFVPRTGHRTLGEASSGRGQWSSIVTYMLRKVADGVYWSEDADGLPMALVTALDDGTSLKVAEQWWVPGQLLLEWAASGAVSDWLDLYGEPGSWG